MVKSADQSAGNAGNNNILRTMVPTPTHNNHTMLALQGIRQIQQPQQPQDLSHTSFVVAPHTEIQPEASVQEIPAHQNKT